MLYPISEGPNFVTGLDHPEGIAVGRDGSLYAGGEAGQVYRISSDGKKVETLANTGGFCLGITLDQEENIYVCDLGRRALMKVSQRGSVTVLAEAVGERKFTSPNFSVFDSKGNLYFSDSGKSKQANGVVCRLRADGRVEVLLRGPSILPMAWPWTPRSGTSTWWKAIWTVWCALK
jgi:gluconolactonase